MVLDSGPSTWVDVDIDNRDIEERVIDCRLEQWPEFSTYSGCIYTKLSCGPLNRSLRILSFAMVGQETLSFYIVSQYRNRTCYC